MRAAVRIAILGDGLVYWGGGIDLLRTLLNGICATPGEGKSIFLLLPKEDWKYRTFLRLTQIRDRFTGLLSRSGQRPTTRTRPTDAELKSIFAPYEDRVQVRFHDGHFQRPSGFAPGNKGKCRVSLPDIPWQRIPRAVDRVPARFSASAPAASVQSAGTALPTMENQCNPSRCQDHCRKCARCKGGCAGLPAPETRATIIALPFTPSIRAQWLNADPLEARKRHDLPKAYFIICNQFWVHKDHKTAFRAFARFLDSRSGDTIRVHSPRVHGEAWHDSIALLHIWTRSKNCCST